MELTLEVLLDGVLWTIRLQKQVDDETRWADVHNIWLVACSDGATTHWSQWALSGPLLTTLRSRTPRITAISLLPGIVRAMRERLREVLAADSPRIVLDLAAMHNFVPPRATVLSQLLWEVQELTVYASLSIPPLERLRAVGGSPVSLELPVPAEWPASDIDNAVRERAEDFYRSYEALASRGLFDPADAPRRIAAARRAIRTAAEIFAIAETTQGILIRSPQGTTATQLAMFPPAADEPTSEFDQESAPSPITKPFDPSKVDVDSRPFTLDLIIRRIREREIDLSPAFQRKDVWSHAAKSRLIESILIRIPLPAFYVDSSNDDKWIVVDGVQRLTALREFVLDQTLSLTGLEFLSQLENQTYAQLPRDLRRRLEETQVTVYLIKAGTPENVKFNIFQRINTGGLPLSPQEIRHALNQGPAATMLASLAVSPEFLEATTGSIPDKRMADREAILRFLAFRMAGPAPDIEVNFDYFLHQAMKKLNNMSATDREKLSSSFKRAMSIASQTLGRLAFRRERPDRRRGPVNKALFDAWSVALAKLSDSQARSLISKSDTLQRSYEQLLHEPDFIIAISQGTADPRKISLRFERVQQLITDVLNGH